MLIFIVFLIFLIFGLPIIVYLILDNNYKKTDYYNNTHNSLGEVFFDKGKLGEYYVYRYLRGLGGYQKYLFNCYLPKADGTTTEIDVIMIHESGIYVFESKNYSGWIFGEESKKYWVQSLPNGYGHAQINYFYNPIMQNQHHIKYLKSCLTEFDTVPIYSFIVFSDRCKLKDITLSSGNHIVVNRYNLFNAVLSKANQVGSILPQNMIDLIYQQLFSFSQVDDCVKQMHIQRTNQYTEQRCPYCGGFLKLKIAQNGVYKGKAFLGCSNYPNCCYIENIDDYGNS